jgi:hypothetical protein
MAWSKMDEQLWGSKTDIPPHDSYLIEKLELLSSILEAKICDALIILRDESLPSEARVIESIQILQEI